MAVAGESREQFMVLGQVVRLPQLFASNALHTVSVLPGGLHAVARVNPPDLPGGHVRQLLVGVGPDRIMIDVAVLVGASW